MNNLRRALAALAMLALAACYPPTTSHPIGMAAGLRPDPVLAGLWKGTSPDGKPGYFHFLPQDDGSLAILIVESGNAPADWNYVSATTAKVGAATYMNARMLSSNGKPETGWPGGTVPVLYRIDAKGQMSLFFLDEKAVKAAIKAGKIKGTAGEGSMGDAVITADPAVLDKFMRSPAALALFAEPFFTLHKVE